MTSPCLAKFTMSNDIEDEAWYDAGPIDICQTLFGGS